MGEKDTEVHQREIRCLSPSLQAVAIWMCVKIKLAYFNRARIKGKEWEEK